jgi:hypothetical protein
MTWSYNTSLTTKKDEVRLKIADTDTNSQEFSDEEINAVLAKKGNDVVQASIELATSLYAKYSKKAVSKRAGAYSEDTKARAQFYKDLIATLAEAATEPWDEAAEYTHGSKAAEDDFVQREDLRDQV